MLLEDSSIILYFGKLWPWYFKKCVNSVETMAVKNKKDRNVLKYLRYTNLKWTKGMS